MFKYDDVISTLTIVNTLARDINYGNQQKIKEKSRLQVSLEREFEKSKFESSEHYELLLVKNCSFKNVKVKSFYKNIFFKIKAQFLQFKIFVDKLTIAILRYFILNASLYKNLLIYLQRMVLI